MENLNFKTGLTCKGGVVTGAIMTLTTAVVLAMAPTSEAFAWGYQKMVRVELQYQFVAHYYYVVYRGYGSSEAEAKKYAKKNPSCNVFPYSGRPHKSLNNGGAILEQWPTKGKMWFGAPYVAIWGYLCIENEGNWREVARG